MTQQVIPITELLAPVQDGLQAMRLFLAQELQEQGPVGERLAHLAQFRGKELRAALVLVVAQAVGNKSAELPQVAAVLELIHLATLVHDDVLDGADLRRNLPSVHVEWDEQTAILLGDMLYSRAFHLSTQLDSVLAARLLSKSAQRICAGELEQAAMRYQFEMPQERYENIAAAKTAELYAAACELGARYPGDPNQEAVGLAKEMRQFGRELGLAFQIIDDVLDLAGSQPEVGKCIGNDVQDGKVTLPVLYVYSKSTQETQAAIRMAYEGPDIADRLQALQLACDLGPGIQYARDRAQELLHSSLERIASLPESQSRETLERIAGYVLDRNK